MPGGKREILKKIDYQKRVAEQRAATPLVSERFIDIMRKHVPFKEIDDKHRVEVHKTLQSLNKDSDRSEINEAIRRTQAFKSGAWKVTHTMQILSLLRK
jgi:hypothetical protein